MCFFRNCSIPCLICRVNLTTDVHLLASWRTRAHPLIKHTLPCSYLETQNYADVPWWILVDQVRQPKSSSFCFFLGLIIRLRYLKTKKKKRAVCRPSPHSKSATFVPFLLLKQQSVGGTYFELGLPDWLKFFTCFLFLFIYFVIHLFIYLLAVLSTEFEPVILLHAQDSDPAYWMFFTCQKKWDRGWGGIPLFCLRVCRWI